MITPWMALVLLDTVTVATFARCFSGPAELAIVLPVCIGAHLLAHLGRRLRGEGRPVAGIALWALTVLLVAYVPLALVNGASFRLGFLPLTGTQHVLGSQLHAAWLIFSNRIAPVSQAPGLVLAAGWAAGLLALAAEALDADTTLPAIVALVPAFDIVVFTGTLGTSTGRAPELAALAALAVWYLAGTNRHPATEQVVTARLEGSGVQPEAGMRQHGGRFGRRSPSAVAGLALVAAVAAGVIGPLVPGATSTALLAWHETGNGSKVNGTGPHGRPPGPVSISQFVDVGEEEIDNTNTPLFRVYGTSPTREILFVDDLFTGSQWTQEPTTLRSPIVPFAASVPELEAHPRPPVLGPKSELVTQAISNIDLAGPVIPTPGLPVAMDGNASATLQGSDGPVTVAPEAFGNNYSYGVQAVLEPSPAVSQEYYDASAPAAPAVDLDVPQPLPAAIRTLAEEIVSGATTEEAKAEAIQDFLLTHFRYQLPKTVPVTQTEGYSALMSFLFTTRTGYCQQFASSFAVLARIDGLASRVVVGFLPTQEKNGSWVVTGLQTHAWPQVYFPGTGWVDFEPTPGAGAPTYPDITTTTLPGATSTTLARVTGSSSPAHNLQPPKNGATGSSFSFPTVPSTPSQPIGGTGGGSSSDVTTVLLALLAVALLWAVSVPSWRIIRDRRTRDPVGAVLLAWREAVGVLAAAGMHRRRAETFVEFSQRVRRAGALTREADEALTRLADIANRALFARLPPSEDDSRRAVADSVVVRRSARRSMSWWAKLLLQLDPRDLISAS